MRILSISFLGALPPGLSATTVAQRMDAGDAASPPVGVEVEIVPGMGADAAAAALADAVLTALPALSGDAEMVRALAESHFDGAPTPGPRGYAVRAG